MQGKRDLVMYGGLILLMILLESVGIFAESKHTLGKQQLTTPSGQVVTARVMDDGRIVYQPFLTATTVSMEQGRLTVVSTTLAHRGMIVRHRESTPAETALWQKYFGS